MPYVTQTFSAGQVLTAAEMNQVQTNLAEIRRSHIGSGTPPELTAGVRWIDMSPASTSGYWDIKTYSGSDWMKEARLYPNSNHVVPYRANSITGTAAVRDTGTDPGDVVLLETVASSGALPPLDGSQLTGRNAPLTGNGIQTRASSSYLTFNLNNGEVLRILHGSSITSLEFTNVATVQEIFLLRENVTARAPALVWPSNITWKGATAPTLSDGLQTVDVIRLLTRTAGQEWYGDYATGATFAEGAYLYTWGLNGTGQLGDGSTTTRTAPTQVSCAVAAWDYVVCLGTNSVGGVASLSGWTFAIDADGNLYATGANSAGQLGFGDTTGRTSFGQVGSATWSSVNGGRNAVAGISLGVRTDGTAWAAGKMTPFSGFVVGSSGWFQLGSATNWQDAFQMETGFDTNPTYGYFNTSSRALYKVNFFSPTPPPYPPTAVQSIDFSPVYAPASSQVYANKLVVGEQNPVFVVVLTSSGGLLGWGANGNGQLATGTYSATIGQNSAVTIGSQQLWVDVDAGPNGHVVAIRDDLTLWGWGTNANGELGQGLVVAASSGYATPVQIGSAADWIAVAAGYGFTLALNTGGELWACGALSGLTGANSYSLSQVGSATTWRRITAGVRHAAGTRD